jgi:acetyltransferase-like isoleucine patch superfamily enzyme
VETLLGQDATVDPTALVGYRHASDAGPTVVGDEARVRANTVIYGDVAIGDGFTTGHGALVREETTVGDDVLVGSNVVLDGHVDVGSHVSLQSGVYVPQETVIADEVFAGPGATLTNDPYPVRREAELVGPTLERGVSVGANATVLPDVAVGERSFVAAGAVVTEDVPPDTLAVGVPAEHRELPPVLEGGNALE